MSSKVSVLRRSPPEPCLDPALKPPEAAQVVNLSVSTLKDKRWRGTGPCYIKLSPGRGGRIRYRLSELERWLSARSVEVEQFLSPRVDGSPNDPCNEADVDALQVETE